MARPPRIQFEGAFYHIFHRGNRRERIFWDASDYVQFEDFMIEAMNWSGVRLFDWSLMPNHFHFLLETPDGNVAEFMQRLTTRYAMYFNWVHRKVGHVFQGRYGAKVCDKESYFLELVRYVELNPYRLKNGRLAERGQWKWASLRYYLGKEEPPEGMQRAMKDVLDRFGSTITRARENLMKFLADGLKTGTWEDFYGIGTNRVLGPEVFIERVKAVMEEPTREQKRSLLKLSDVPELGAKVQACFGVTHEKLAKPGKERACSRIRQAVVEVGRKQYRFSVYALAEYLGRSEPAISRMIRRGWEKGQVLEETQRLLAFLETSTQTPESDEPVVPVVKC